MIDKATPSDVGCWIDGHWGQYANAQLIETAIGFGCPVADGVRGLAHLHMRECTHPGFDGKLSPEDHERIHDATVEVEEWLNDNVMPEGFSVGWFDGEFFMWSDAEWETV